VLNAAVSAYRFAVDARVGILLVLCLALWWLRRGNGGRRIHRRGDRCSCTGRRRDHGLRWRIRGRRGRRRRWLAAILDKWRYEARGGLRGRVPKTLVPGREGERRDKRPGCQSA